MIVDVLDRMVRPRSRGSCTVLTDNRPHHLLALTGDCGGPLFSPARHTATSRLRFPPLSAQRETPQATASKWPPTGNLSWPRSRAAAPARPIRPKLDSRRNRPTVLPLRRIRAVLPGTDLLRTLRVQPEVRNCHGSSHWAGVLDGRARRTGHPRFRRATEIGAFELGPAQSPSHVKPREPSNRDFLRSLGYGHGSDAAPPRHIKGRHLASAHTPRPSLNRVVAKTLP